MDWRSYAACRDEDPELFFPVGTGGPALLQTLEAQAVCARCLVKRQCREWAMTPGELSIGSDPTLDFGVFGGLAQHERYALHRLNARTQQRHGTTTVSAQPVRTVVVDEVMVQRLVSAGPQPSASRAEIAHAAVRLVEKGSTPFQAARHLGEYEHDITKWVGRARRGEPLLRRTQVARTNTTTRTVAAKATRKTA